MRGEERFDPSLAAALTVVSSSRWQRCKWAGQPTDARLPCVQHCIGLLPPHAGLSDATHLPLLGLHLTIPQLALQANALLPQQLLLVEGGPGRGL